EYIESARIAGAYSLSIMFKHILPNALSPLVVNATLQIALLILAEAGLSFLGIGVKPPIPSWGNMLSSAQQLEVLRTRYWLWIPPGLLISATVLAINFLGDGLRDAVDPYSGV
ncbi:MAG: ABC transporter permease, partial [Halanaerobiales bacterium]